MIFISLRGYQLPKMNNMTKLNLMFIGSRQKLNSRLSTLPALEIHGTQLNCRVNFTKSLGALIVVLDLLNE